MKKVIAVLVLALGVSAILVPSALAARSDFPVNKMIAQEDCGGGVCITDEVTDFGGPSIDPATVPDAPGKYTRSLIMIALFGALFVVYLRWALVRGAKIG